MVTKSVTIVNINESIHTTLLTSEDMYCNFFLNLFLQIDLNFIR